MRRPALLKLAVAVLAVAVAVAGVAVWRLRPRPPGGAAILRRHGLAGYEWHGPGRLPADPLARLRFLRAEGFTAVYLDLSDYLDAAELPAGAARRARLARVGGDLRRFVAAASGLGLSVQAVGGTPSWTAPSHRYLGPALLRLVARYNAAAAPGERLRGVQFDIEPYREPGFARDQRAGLADYLATAREIVAAYRRLPAGGGGLQLGFAIPFWFDGTAGPPPVAFAGATKPAAQHLIDLLRDLPGGYVVVMSYRNVAGGADGSIVHAQGPLRYAAAVRAACGVVVGQEFDDIQPAKVTFHGLGRGAFRRQAAAIVAAYDGLPQFRGVSVNDADSFAAAPA